MKRKIMNKKGAGTFEGLMSLGIGIASLAILLVVTFLIISNGEEQIGDIEGFDETNATQCDDSVACNATTTLKGAVSDIPGWIPLIVIVFIGAIILGLVKTFKQ